VGVIPDIRVPVATALDVAVAEAKKAAEEFGRSQDETLKESIGEMQELADSAAVLYREGKDEAAAAALDSLFGIVSREGMMSEFFLFVLAYNFQSPQDERMALAILKKNVEFYPESITANDLMATVCASKGKNELALKHFRKVLELDPGNGNARRMIKELEK